jgi:hypothetical protein
MAPKKSVRLGSVTSATGALVMIVADARVAASFQGVHNADESDPNGGDCDFERPRAVLIESGGPCAAFEFGAGRALALALGVGSGDLSVWSVGARLTLFEGMLEADEEDPAIAQFVGERPAANALASLEIPSGQLVISPSTDACTDVAGRLKKRTAKSRAEPCGSDLAALLVSVSAGTYDLAVEETVVRAWGTGRRCHLVATKAK